MSSQDEQFPAAAPEPAGSDEGMTWWYRWLCRIAGVIGGMCEYPLPPACPLLHDRARLGVLPAVLVQGGCATEGFWGDGLVPALGLLCLGWVQLSVLCAHRAC